MDALSNILNSLSQGWKNMSGGRKVGIIVLVSGILSAIIFFMVYLGRPQYEPLFLSMSPEDMAKVVEELKQEKVDYKLDGSSILVQRDEVEELRLSVLSSGVMPSGGKGFELFDESRFGITDTETRIMYQRALEGELQRTIKGFNQVDYAIVRLVLPEPSVFVRDEAPARASVTLKLKNNKVLAPEDVKAIVALITGSVSNLPKENVEVIDSNFNYLSENLYNEDFNSPPSINNRQEITGQFESKLQDDIKKMLEAVFGPNKVRVSVNANLDFDARETTSIKYDTEGIIKNQYRIIETVTESGGDLSGSPIDNQSSNTVEDGDGTTTTTREEDTTNYNVGQVEEKTIKAPGQVKRITTSVVVDGTLSEAVKASVTNLVTSAIGYDEMRGDLISVEGIPFDTSLQKKAEEDLKAIAVLEQAEARRKRLVTYIGYPAAGLIGLILLLILMSRVRSALRKPAASGGGVDVVIDEPVTVNEIIKTKSILDEEDDEANLTTELKKYAARKPDQVVEIVKSWLSEDER